MTLPDGLNTVSNSVASIQQGLVGINGLAVTTMPAQITALQQQYPDNPALRNLAFAVADLQNRVKTLLQIFGQ